MKPKEIEAIRNNLYEQTGGWQHWTPNLRKLDIEMSCRDMMISIFCYHGIGTLRNEQSYFFQQYLQEYIEKLGRKRFDEIREDMIKDFKKAVVHRDVSTDSEGCSYNSIEWEEE